MAEHATRKRVGVRRVGVSDVHHIKVFYDKDIYASHPNRGGLWNFGDGEIAVAHRLKRVDYKTGEGVNFPYHHDFSHSPWGDESGILLHRSHDNGQTWPEGERVWIWSNKGLTLDETLNRLRPVDVSRRQRIDMGSADAILHFNYAGEHLKFPFGGVDTEHEPPADPIKAFHLGRVSHLSGGDNPPTFSMRSPDRGRTWEHHVAMINGPDKGGGAQIVNLGYVRFDSGVLGALGHTKRLNQQVAAFFVSYDNGMSWRFLSEVARQPDPVTPMTRFTYNGVHMLPDGRLMACMLEMPGNLPCVAFSEDDGMSWSGLRFIVGPGSWDCALLGQPSPRALEDNEGPLHRSPHALVTRSGRIVVMFARRWSVAGGRGILGVVSDDLGETWSKEFVVRGDQYAWDGGYPLVTELPDGGFFVVYYFTEKPAGPAIPAYACVRHIAGTFFRLD